MAIEVHLGRVFVLGIKIDEQTLGLEALKVDFGVEHVGQLRGDARRAAYSQAFLPKVRASVTDTETKALPGTHTAENELGSVGTLTGAGAVIESALDEIVDGFDEGGLALGPKPRLMVAALRSLPFAFGIARSPCLPRGRT